MKTTAARSRGPSRATALRAIAGLWWWTNNLADKERDRLIAMIGMWYVEAGKYNVLPIDSRGTLRFAEERPEIALPRKKYVFYPGTQSTAGSSG